MIGTAGDGVSCGVKAFTAMSSYMRSIAFLKMPANASPGDGAAEAVRAVAADATVLTNRTNRAQIMMSSEQTLKARNIRACSDLDVNFV